MRTGGGCRTVDREISRFPRKERLHMPGSLTTPGRPGARAVVAGKPTNKAVPTAAEPVEPRAGAKGNASQQSTHRTQGRERVSQALERVRQAAQRKKEKFTALLHHISIDSLRMAFFAVKRDAASGVDGLT